jgi:hypothetical protein
MDEKLELELAGVSFNHGREGNFTVISENDWP